MEKNTEEKGDFFDEMVKSGPYYQKDEGERAIEKMFFETESPDDKEKER